MTKPTKPVAPRLLRIGIDFDNTTVKSGKLKSDYAWNFFRKNIPPPMFRRKWVVNSLKILTFKEYQQIREAIYKNIKTAYRLDDVDGALHFLRALIEEGHYITVITSQQGFGLKIVKAYLARHKLAINYVGVGYGKTKANAAKRLKLDVFMDDDVHKLEKLVGVVPYLFLHDWAYNGNDQVDPNVIERVGDEHICAWERFYERIHEIENERDP